MKLYYKKAYIISIIGMCIIIFGMFWAKNYGIQQETFLVGNILMLGGAVLDKYLMYKVLERVIIIGTILGFVGSINLENYFIIMLISGVLAMGYLIYKKDFSKDKFSIIGSLGLWMLAIGYSLQAQTNLDLTMSFFGLGGISLSIYSIYSYKKYKSNISLIFTVLNILFSIGPIIYFTNNLLLK